MGIPSCILFLLSMGFRIITSFQSHLEGCFYKHAILKLQKLLLLGLKRQNVSPNLFYTVTYMQWLSDLPVTDALGPVYPQLYHAKMRYFISGPDAMEWFSTEHSLHPGIFSDGSIIVQNPLLFAVPWASVRGAVLIPERINEDSISSPGKNKKVLIILKRFAFHLKRILLSKIKEVV